MHLPAALRFVGNGVFLAILAHSILGISLVWDKVLLERPAMKSLANYVFWLGAMSILGLCLIPFGFRMPAWRLAGLGMAAGAIQMGAIWFYYAALKNGEASEALAVMGGFAPLATALIAIPLLAKPLGDESILAFVLMVAGGFVMFVSEKFHWRKVLPNVLASALLFGVTNDLQKIVFNRTGGFVTGYVFFTIGTFLAAMALLVRPVWRQQIFQQSHEAPPKSKLWYFVNRFLSGVGSFLIFLAISKTSPAEVSAIAGVRYVIIFLGAYLLTRMKPQWLRENFTGRVLVGKGLATGIIIAGLVLSAFGGGSSSASGGSNRSKMAWRSAVHLASGSASQPLHFAHLCERLENHQGTADYLIPYGLLPTSAIGWASVRLQFCKGGTPLKENMGSKEQKIRMAIGAAAAASAIFAPLAYKWKGLLAFAAFSGLFTGVTGHSPFKRVMGLGR